MRIFQLTVHRLRRVSLTLLAIACCIFTGSNATPTADAQTAADNQRSEPEFSWDTVPRWVIFRSQRQMSAASLERVAEHYQVVMMEKSNSQGLGNSEAGFARLASTLKGHNPDIVNLAYWNTFWVWPSYAANQTFYDNYQDWSREESPITNGRMAINHDNADLRDWWGETALEINDIPGVDGLFLDTLRDRQIDRSA